MPTSGPIPKLELTKEQAETLIALVSIGELAIRFGLKPTRPDDARLFQAYVETYEQRGVSLERPLTDLRKWLNQERRTT